MYTAIAECDSVDEVKDIRDNVLFLFLQLHSQQLQSVPFLALHAHSTNPAKEALNKWRK